MIKQLFCILVRSFIIHYFTQIFNKLIKPIFLTSANAISMKIQCRDRNYVKNQYQRIFPSSALRIENYYPSLFGFQLK